jgi:prevent-host-death family protein
MAISVTELKHRCLEIVRGIERTGRSVSITRRGRVVASLQPAAESRASLRPWERLRGSAECRFTAVESVLNDEDFEALR